MVDDANAGLAGTILVIDDERNIRRTLRMVLEGEGATVLDAETAEAGLELIQRSLAESEAPQPIQVVMADVLLPGMSGLEILTAIRANPASRDLPVMMLTARGRDREMATRAGADRFMTKPFSNAEILAEVRAMLGRGVART